MRIYSVNILADWFSVCGSSGGVLFLLDRGEEVVVQIWNRADRPNAAQRGRCVRAVGFVANRVAFSHADVRVGAFWPA